MVNLYILDERGEAILSPSRMRWMLWMWNRDLTIARDSVYEETYVVTEFTGMSRTAEGLVFSTHIVNFGNSTHLGDSSSRGAAIHFHDQMVAKFTDVLSVMDRVE